MEIRRSSGEPMKQKENQVHNIVRDRYAEIAKNAPAPTTSGTCSPASDCCGGGTKDLDVEEVANLLGYTKEELKDIPQGSNMGLGCGNPQAIAALTEGEIVLDLGSGGGVDCFLASKKVGKKGKVIGIDMTPEMLEKARKTAREGNFDNVEFRLGEIEYLPVADNSVDIIMSNCVLNLSPQKLQVLKEAFRILKKGGRLAISDVVATSPLPNSLMNDPALLTGCITGAARVADLQTWMQEAGFQDIHIEVWEESRNFIKDWAPGSGIEKYVVSAQIQAKKPGACCG
jgi:SAM-dependent methyltransferase